MEYMEWAPLGGGAGGSATPNSITIASDWGLHYCMARAGSWMGGGGGTCGWANRGGTAQFTDRLSLSHAQQCQRAPPCQTTQSSVPGTDDDHQA